MYMCVFPAGGGAAPPKHQSTNSLRDSLIVCRFSDDSPTVCKKVKTPFDGLGGSTRALPGVQEGRVGGKLRRLPYAGPQAKLVWFRVGTGLTVIGRTEPMRVLQGPRDGDRHSQIPSSRG